MNSMHWDRFGISICSWLRCLATVAISVTVFTAGSADAWEMEAGQTALPATSVGSTYQTVLFQTPFSEIPLVFVMPTMEGAEPTSVRVRNASRFGFELVQVEAPAADGPHWEGLTLFLEDPRIPLDNNAAERALRGVVVGRKIHYGSKSKRGTEVAAIFYTLFETAKLSGVNPRDYVTLAACRAVADHGAVTLPSDLT